MQTVSIQFSGCSRIVFCEIEECKITPDQNQICALLSHRTKYGILRYNIEPNQRLTKTTIYIMKVVKYNKARIIKVFNALLSK